MRRSRPRRRQAPRTAAANVPCGGCGCLSLFVCRVSHCSARPCSVNGPVVTGEYVTYPVNLALNGTTNAAGLQFDLDFDAGSMELVNVEAGPAADAAGKDVVYSMVIQTRCGCLWWD